MAFAFPRSLLADHRTAAGTPPPAATSFSPSVAVIAVVLTTMFSLTFLLLLYAKHCRRRHVSVPANTIAIATVRGEADRRGSGVDRAVVETLPLFRFGSLLGEKDGIECAVCLGRFEATEILRLLPKCRHAFHVDCVDAWLNSHSTCPLCRAGVHPEDILLLNQSDPPTTAAGRRISGRHSSAGEKSSVCIVVAPERERKDGTLMGDGHRVVFSGGEGREERWSDLRPSDLMFLRSETTITASGRFSMPGAGDRPSQFRLRSASEITGMSRVEANRNSRAEVEEDRTLRKWVRFAAKRTVRWLGYRAIG
ncbi:hypothetical protein HPP92_015801 [Vanilla planifolia]|uniref:RING-type E3 ubiquitin transferase n=2 Tax=Vanilla planifolia TaxID=51239 RepID=A0A835QJV1_VANPL|nr:hypothetical protein HPP92_015801 [Vanilla planifolia]